MRRVPLKKFDTFKGQDPMVGPIDGYAAMLAVIVANPADRARGMQYEEMRQSVAISTRLDAARASSADHVLLEEADFHMLVKKVKAFPFAFAHAELLRFIDDVAAAESVEVAEKEGR